MLKVPSAFTVTGAMANGPPTTTTFVPGFAVPVIFCLVPLYGDFTGFTVGAVTAKAVCIESNETRKIVRMRAHIVFFMMVSLKILSRSFYPDLIPHKSDSSSVEGFCVAGLAVYDLLSSGFV